MLSPTFWFSIQPLGGHLAVFMQTVMSSSDEEVLFLATIVQEEERRVRKRKMWVHEINAKRRTLGEYYHLFPDLLRDRKKFVKYFRMSQEKFYELLEIIRPDVDH